MTRIPVYLWAGTSSLLGLIFVPLALISGGNVRIVTGVLEVSGGLVGRFLKSRLFMLGGAGAMTLGHVVLGQDEAWLASSRNHERVHVRQYERWGMLMIPLYLWSSYAAWLRGGHHYWDNRFEQEAHGHWTVTCRTLRVG